MLVPVIISGGSGTRLWPVSREARPKPFMQLQGGLTLIQSTWLRAAAIPGVKWLLTVTNREYYFQSKELLDGLQAELQGKEASFLLEPVGRNTAAAVAMSAFMASDRCGPETLLLVLPADHLIADEPAFVQTVAKAVTAAAGGAFVTFGVIPTAPETGYGYIECEGPWESGVACKVKRFVEKPDFERARKFLESGNFLWNSGMFCFRADTILAAIQKFAPEVFEKTREAWMASSPSVGGDAQALYIDAESFAKVPGISIDYAVMEHADNVVVIPSEIAWKDIGSWRSIAELGATDTHGNKVIGEAVLVESTNVYIQGDRRMIAAVGVDNLIVVDTPDALLIIHPDKTQLVKQVVDRLRLDGHESAKWHKSVHRPWGTYTVLEEEQHYKMKRIVVKPAASLSLQMHKHRSEHWIVVAGVAEVINGDERLRLEKNQSTYIQAGHKHRLSNSGDTDLVLIEVQTGDYLGEDDIVRLKISTDVSPTATPKG